MNPQSSIKGPFGSTLSWEDLWHNESVSQLFDNSYFAIRDYLSLTKNTESPRQYHLWSLLSLTAALVSNNTYLSRGIGGKLKLNLGVILTGRAAVRKSSAISFMQRFASELNLNYGPSDTAGARHGIMAAMQSRWQDDIKDDSDDSIPDNLGDLATSSFDSVIARLGRPRTRPSSIYFASKELGRLLTAQTRELLDFFADGLDGESIFYQTKNGNIRIPTPLINLLGATTPGNLPSILPRDAHDHGLLSRLIFVYAGKSASAVPVPPSITTAESNLQSQLVETLLRVSQEAQGEIVLSVEADEEYRRLYEYTVPTLEFRLNAYSGRRADHLAKLAALICLLRSESPYIISRRDMGLAHFILILTEMQMDGAYMGLARTTEDKAYTLIREIMESIDKHAHERGTLYAHLSRAGFLDDESTKIIERLVKSGRLTARGDQLHLAESMGGEKARHYLNELSVRLTRIDSARSQLA